VTLKVAVFTGSRADWGLLSMPSRALVDRGAAVTIIATGQHAGPSGTARFIAADGFDDVELIDMGLSGDGGAALVKAVARLQAGLADALERRAPDMMLILGDRYEALAAASSATLMRIPIAHIAGGDITEGAIDDAIRHAISKLSHLHFVTSDDARQRLLAMGEQPDRIAVSGSPGIDRLKSEAVMSRDAFFERVGLTPRRRNIVMTFHPVTLADDGFRQLEATLAALDAFGDELGVIFTGVNADPGYKAYDDRIRVFCGSRSNAVHHAALGSLLYTNALRHCDAVAGNSSSGLYEAPSFRKPTVNIGDRQQGRLRATSVIDCPAEATAIRAGLETAFSGDWSATVNPYGEGAASSIIADRIAGVAEPQRLLRKVFREGPAA
jgi:UDP-hydrolysing UDP-N-acetyl-D-glucosamine 2-epimerase